MKSNTNAFEYIQNQYSENEWQTNKSIGIISIGFIILCAVTQFSLQLDYSYSVAKANLHVFFPICLLNAVFYIIAWAKHFEGAWIKNMLMAGIILVSVGFFCVFTTYMSYFVLVPIIISTRYFNKEFIHRISVTTALLFILSCIINLLFDSSSRTFAKLHENNVYNSWARPIDAMVYIILPMLLVFVFVVLYSLNTSSKGRMLLKKQGEAVGRIASVEAELNMGSEIQKSALPESSYTDAEGRFRIEANETPAKEVGGDFYDYFMANDHIAVFLIADVSDKGIPAAMFMMSAKKAIQSAIHCCHSLYDGIELANRLICLDNKSGMFLTLWLGIIDTRSGVGKYVNAGHPPPILKRADGSVSLLENEPDLFLGTFPERPPAANIFRMSEGDTLLLYTDGITDAMDSDGSSFGMGKLLCSVENASADAKDIIRHVTQSTAAHVGTREQFDDMTMLAFQCLHLDGPKHELISVSADLEGTRTVIDSVDTILRSCACPDDCRRNVGVIVDEICANICDYAYDGEAGEFNVEITAGSSFADLCFIDSGVEFNPLSHSDPVFSDEPLIGGLGIYLTKSLADEISYERLDGSNRLSISMLWDI